jgi:hypothetical protein
MIALPNLYNKHSICLLLYVKWVGLVSTYCTIDRNVYTACTSRNNEQYKYATVSDTLL